MAGRTIASVTGTVCQLFRIEAGGIEPSLSPVIERAKALGLDRCERVLLYAPDAVGLPLCDAFPEALEAVAREAPTIVRVRSVVPPVTPVCFATMFTGRPPASHGIRTYERPALRCETLFDRLVSAGKRVAIVAVRDSSIDRIFRGRAIDYFSEIYDPEVTTRTLQLLEEDRHDFVLAYHQEYDDTLHRTTPGSPEAVEALRNHVHAFVQLARAAAEFWAPYPRVLGFVPDHGAHVDPHTGKGTHGLDIPEDMDVRHFYGVFPRGAASTATADAAP
jgi:hypothetical protein